MKKGFGWLALLMISLLLLAGCLTSETSTASSRDFTQNKARASTELSTLSAGDTLELSVEVDGQMEVMAHRAQINRQGMVTLPLVGDVKISGQSLSRARGTIFKTYGAYYVNPPVIMLSLQVDPEDGEWGAVIVMGRVIQPGRVPLRSQNGMNLTEAIQAAGGFAPSANKSKIRVSRTDKDGKKLKVFVDFEEIGQKGDMDSDIKLIDGDIIYVPQRIF